MHRAVAIDGARANCSSVAVAGPLCPAIYCNHSRSPNARLEHWPSSAGTAGSLDRLVLVASTRAAIDASLRRRGGRAPRFVRRGLRRVRVTDAAGMSALQDATGRARSTLK